MDPVNAHFYRIALILRNVKSQRNVCGKRLLTMVLRLCISICGLYRYREWDTNGKHMDREIVGILVG